MTTTHRENEPGGAADPARRAPNAVNAAAGAPARASIPAVANTKGELETNRSSPTDGDNEAGRLARLAAWATPPSPKRTAPPTWEQLRWHGEHGQHAPKVGWPRTAAIYWSRTAAQPVRALAVWLDWLSRSPSRCLVAVVLYSLLAHVPGLTWLPWFF